MQNRSHLRRILAALLATAVALPLCVSLSACKADEASPTETTVSELDEEEEENSPTYPLPTPEEDTPAPISPALQNRPAAGNGHRFVDDAEKERWLEPLTTLLSTFTPPPGERSIPQESEGIPPIPMSHACGLLDVTADGIPELLVYPFGGGGSSGNAFYHIFDIFTGIELGTMDGGHEDQWCYYYDTVADECRLYGQFSWRYGWSGRERHVQRVAYIEERQEYDSIPYLRSYHSIDAVAVTDPDGVEGWNEVYDSTEYFLNERPVSLDDFYWEYDEFTRTCIRIPETGFQLIWWDRIADEEHDYSDSEGYYARQAPRMAYALIHSEQEFLAP